MATIVSRAIVQSSLQASRNVFSRVLFRDNFAGRKHRLINFTRKFTTGNMNDGCNNRYIFRQLFEQKSCTFTYLIGDVTTGDAILIDPVIDTVDRDINIVKELGLKLKYAANTHVHADHITGTGDLKAKIGCKSVISKISGAKADIYLKEDDSIDIGSIRLVTKSTPGHTNGCTTYIWEEGKMAFTGDTLLIRGCGRTDFQQGNPGNLYDSVHKTILSLPDDTLLYPAHDYTGQTVTTVGEERKYNRRLTKTKDEFIQIMEKLNLPYPKQIDHAVPANLMCGIQDPSRD